MGKTSIEWTATQSADGTVTPGRSWNPIRARRKDTGKVGWHCERVSEECDHCYSETHNGRNLPAAGTALDYVRRSRDLVDIFLDEEMLRAPLKWKKPGKVFVASMTDAFAEFVPDEFLDRMFAVMALCPHLTFQVLTKRPERMQAYLSSERIGQVLRLATSLGKLSGRLVAEVMAAGTLPNVWLGVSAGTQKWADLRIPLLLQTPAAVRFVSYEPALGPVDFRPFVDPDQCDHIRYSCEEIKCCGMKKIDWVIVGGESGPGARPFNVKWAQSVVRECRGAGVPVFVKQLGSLPIISSCRQNHWDWGAAWGEKARFENFSEQPPMWRIRLKDRKGGDMSEWATHLRVRQFPEARAHG